MYGFRDTTSDWHFHEEWLPSFAMCYDGEFLEHIVPGYRTLSVVGREMLGYEFTKENALLGSIVTSERIPDRTLTITYQLEASTSEGLQIAFKALERALKKKTDVPIMFNDERDWTYYGRYETASEVPGETNSVISSYTILCSDPRRFGKEITMGAGRIVRLGEFVPVTIEFDLPPNTSYFISNGVQRIHGVNTNVATQTHVKLDFMSFEAYANGNRSPKIIALSSDFENFEIKTDMQITTNTKNFKLTYKEVS